jgi:hypothetical protein
VEEVKGRNEEAGSTMGTPVNVPFILYNDEINMMWKRSK